MNVSRMNAYFVTEERRYRKTRKLPPNELAISLTNKNNHSRPFGNAEDINKEV